MKILGIKFYKPEPYSISDSGLRVPSAPVKRGIHYEHMAFKKAGISCHAIVFGSLFVVKWRIKRRVK